MTTTWAIIQARMGSKRLPGKSLMDIGGKTMLRHVIERTRQAVPDVMVATTTLQEDDVIEAEAKAAGASVHRGHPTDVLERYAQAAFSLKAEKVVRITADCPLIDPLIIKHVVEALTPHVDYSSNLYPRSFPKGLDCEAMWADVLLRLDRLSTPEEREHVTAAISRCRHLFSIANVANHAHINWSVDTQADLDRVRKLYAAL